MQTTTWEREVGRLDVVKKLSLELCFKTKNPLEGLGVGSSSRDWDLGCDFFSVGAKLGPHVLSHTEAHRLLVSIWRAVVLAVWRAPASHYRMPRLHLGSAMWIKK